MEEFFVKSQSEIYEEAYLNYRDRLEKMGPKNKTNPKKMQGVRRAVAEQFDLEIDEIDDILDEFNYGKVDPSDPKTWVKFQNGRFDIGAANLVEESAATAKETAIYRKLINDSNTLDARVRTDLGVVEQTVADHQRLILKNSRTRPRFIYSHTTR